MGTSNRRGRKKRRVTSSVCLSPVIRDHLAPPLPSTQGFLYFNQGLLLLLLLPSHIPLLGPNPQKVCSPLLGTICHFASPPFLRRMGNARRFFCNASRAHFPPVWHPLLFGRSPRTLHFLHSKINVCGAGYLFLTRMDMLWWYEGDSSPCLLRNGTDLVQLYLFCTAGAAIKKGFLRRAASIGGGGALN